MWQTLFPFTCPVRGAIAGAVYAYVFGADVQRGARIGAGAGAISLLVRSASTSRHFNAPVVEEVVSAAELPAPSAPVSTSAGSCSSVHRLRVGMGCPGCGGACGQSTMGCGGPGCGCPCGQRGGYAAGYRRYPFA